MKVSKFQISYNPHFPNEKYILHTRKPAFLSQIIEHKNKDDQDSFGKMIFEKIEKKEIPFAFVSRTELKGKFFSFLVIELYESIKIKNNMTSQQAVDNVASIMRRLADWYRSI